MVRDAVNNRFKIQIAQNTLIANTFILLNGKIVVWTMKVMASVPLNVLHFDYWKQR